MTIAKRVMLFTYYAEAVSNYAKITSDCEEVMTVVCAFGAVMPLTV